MQPDTNIWRRLILETVESERLAYASNYSTGCCLYAHNMARKGGAALAGWETLAAELAASIVLPDYKVSVWLPASGYEKLGPGFQIDRLPDANDELLMQQWTAFLTAALENAQHDGVVYRAVTDADLQSMGCSAIPCLQGTMEVGREKQPVRYGFPWAYLVAKQFREHPDYKVYVHQPQSGKYEFVLSRRQLPDNFDKQGTIDRWVRLIKLKIAQFQGDVICSFLYAAELAANGCDLIVCDTLARQAALQASNEKYEVRTHSFDFHSGRVEDMYFVIQARVLPKNVIMG